MALKAARWGVQVLPKIRPVKAVNTDWEVGKYENQLDCIQPDATQLEKKAVKFDYIVREYCKVGLLNHDQLQEYDPIIIKARRRMTEDEAQARYFRVNRALIMSANHQILPEDEWTPMDADHNYLNRHIHQVKQEEMEKTMMKCAMRDFDDAYQRLTLIPFRIRNYVAIRNLRKTLEGQLVDPKLC